MSRQPEYSNRLRARDALALAIVLAGLPLTWSCQPGPAPPETQVDLVSWAWMEEVDAILLVTSLEEADPFRTHGRVELSWLNGEGREVFRALYNTSSRANPVPPEAYGVFNLEDDTVESAGIEAYMEVTLGGFTLLTDSVTDRQDGLLSVAWAVRPPESLTGPIELRARVLPKSEDSGVWLPLGVLEHDDEVWRVAEANSREAVFDGRLPDPYAIMLEEGDAAAALRSLEELWDRGDDPRTIRAIRTKALGQIDESGGFTTGDESYVLSDIRALFEWLLLEPDVLRLRLPVEGDLAPERLLYLAIVVGEEHASPAQENSSYVMPEIDLHAALLSPDPWVVSAALFLARKQDIEIDLSGLLARWLDSNSWDETCTDQALLYIAGRPAEELTGISDIPPEVADLEEAKTDGVEIQAWSFLSSGQWDPDLTLFDSDAGLVLEVRDSTMDVIHERPVSAGNGTLTVSATNINYYSFRYLDDAMHGESRFISGTGGTFVRMAVAVEGGV